MQAHGPSPSLSEVILRYPEPLGQHGHLNPDVASQWLLRAITIASQTPFVWSYIDKPADGAVYLVFLMQPQQLNFPNDGIRFQENEQRALLQINQGRELEFCQQKSGFVPDGSDTIANRVRRRYRFTKGGHPQLCLVHYTREGGMPIIPSLLGTPVRAYPLRPVNEPATYVLGEKVGQKVYPPGMPHPQPHALATAHPHHQGAPPLTASASVGSMGGMGGMGAGGISVGGMGVAGHQAMLAQQSREMEALERRQQRGRAQPMVASRLDDEDSGDEHDHISTRSLALARYKRNHDFMNEVFMHAAFGMRNKQELPSPYAGFKKEELQSKIDKLSAEVDELKAKAASRAEARARNQSQVEGSADDARGDVSMEGFVPAPQAVTA